MQLLKIKPYDNTFFGTGKVLNLGDNDYIQSKSIPYPSVFFGAIFTALLSENKKFRKAFFNNDIPDHTEILKIGQVYLFNEKEDEVYIPAPKDIFVNSSKVKVGKFVDAKYISLRTSKLLKAPIDSEYRRVTNHFINLRNIYSGYLNKDNNSIEILSEEDIFKKAIKIGIGMEMNRRVVEKDKLYKLEQTEFISNDWSFLVEYEIQKDYLENKYKDIINYLSNGCLKLGGENKVCKYSKTINSVIEEFNDYKPEIVNNEFKLIFTSDTYFKKNIYDLFEQSFEILGISNDKPIYIGGFDMISSKNKKYGAPRRMYKGFSAGTILLLRMNKGVKRKQALDDLKKIMKLEYEKGFNKYIVMEDK